MPLRAGRFFAVIDDANAPAVIVVSAATARRYFGKADPLGRRLIAPGSRALLSAEIVGDIRRSGRTDEFPLQVHRPLAPRPLGVATLMVRTAKSPPP